MKKRYVIALTIFCAFAPLREIYSQVSLSEEALRQEAAGNYDNLGKLQLLAGDTEGAAASFSKASDNLSASRALFSMGQWEAAYNSLLAETQKPNLQPKNFYEAQILAAGINSFANLEAAPLNMFLDNDIYSYEQSFILYSLWKITGEASWANSLSQNYPQSPEGRILWGENVLAALSPFWVFYPGIELALNATEDTEHTENTETSEAPESAENVAVATSGYLQTGLFGNKGNAEKLAKRLGNAGMEAVLVEREVNNSTYWAVMTPPGDDQNATTLKLKDMGLEAFPVY